MSRISLDLTVAGPFLTRGLDQAGFRLDATRARDASGRPVLPFSHLRGHLRESLVELLATLEGGEPQVAKLERAAARLFGSADQPGQQGGTTSAVAPASWSLARVGGETGGPPRRHDQSWRVSIDASTGASRSRHLTVTEAGSCADLWMVKAGLDVAPVPGLSDDQAALLIAAAASWLGGFGKSGSDGWGRVVARRVEVDGRRFAPEAAALQAALRALLADAPRAQRARPAAPTVAPLRAAGRQAQEVTFTLLGPLMVGEERRGTNVIRGRTDIPGSVVRRALADELLVLAHRPRGGWVDGALRFDTLPKELGCESRDLEALAAAFGEVRVGFGVPLHPTDGSPARVSAVTTFGGSRFGGHSAVVDLFGELIHGQLEEVDAKESWLDDPGLVLGHGFVRRTLHAHVAKDRYSGAARQGMLFVYSAVAERWSDGPGPEGPARYRFTVSAPAACQRALAALLPRICRLGKAVGRGYGLVEASVAAQTLADSAAVGHDRRVRLTLTSEALLLPRQGCDLGVPLTEVYTEAWTRALSALQPGAAVQVPHLFAAHRLRGGVTAGGPGAVPPVMLTRAGSTFLLTWEATADRAVRAALVDALALGVENPEEVTQAQAHWKRPCPFRVANGYGEVRIDPIETRKGG